MVPPRCWCGCSRHFLCWRAAGLISAGLTAWINPVRAVEITTWTHKINGLTESDFILAAKIDQLATAITDEKSRDFQKLMQVVKEAPPQTGSK